MKIGIKKRMRVGVQSKKKKEGKEICKGRRREETYKGVAE